MSVPKIFVSTSAVEKPPVFFVPDVTLDKQEETYANLAQRAGRPVPKRGERIYSITYTHNGEIWTSTVGQTSRGISHRTVGRGSKKRDEPRRLSDPSTVLAIFPGNPHLTFTHRARGSTWANPFMIGESSISSKTLFTIA
jgi:hypothetical protein